MVRTRAPTAHACDRDFAALPCVCALARQRHPLIPLELGESGAAASLACATPCLTVLCPCSSFRCVAEELWAKMLGNLVKLYWEDAKPSSRPELVQRAEKLRLKLVDITGGWDEGTNTKSPVHLEVMQCRLAAASFTWARDRQVVERLSHEINAQIMADVHNAFWTS